MRTVFSIKNILFTICVVPVLILTGYFLFENQAMIGMLIHINT